MSKDRENDNEMEEEEGEMVKWRDTMDTMDKKEERERLREADNFAHVSISLP